jgi:hypothetical protein
MLTKEVNPAETLIVQVRDFGMVNFNSRESYGFVQTLPFGDNRIWMKNGDGVSCINGFHASNYRPEKNMPKGFFVEKHFLRVEGIDGHTILMPGQGVYGFPIDENYEQILTKITGSLIKQKNLYLDEEKKTVWIEDVLFVSLGAESDFYESIGLTCRDGFPVYIVKINKESPAYLFNSKLYRKVSNMQNIKIDSLTNFIFSLTPTSTSLI